MDTLQDRLAGLAEGAPTGGEPPAELWSRGRRARRRRVAAVAACLLVVGALGAGIGLRLAGGAGDHSRVEPAGTLGFTLPLNYPGRADLPRLGAAPGPLAALWLTPPSGGRVPQVVALVAETGTFGTLSLDLPRYDSEVTGQDVALSADGRRVAYLSPTRDLVVHDLVTGDDVRPAIQTRPGFTWVDATHLFGHDGARGGDADAWVWQPGTEPRLVDYYAFTAGFALVPPEPVLEHPDCSTPPTVTDSTGRLGTENPQGGSEFQVPWLCDVLGVIGTHTLLGHDPNDQVVALDVHDGPAFSDPNLRQVVALQGAPLRATFATDLIGEALTPQGGVS
ncbi:hypothetical protein FB382_001722 [Nocardioides ginsengisegetis]|uniref:Uncharacterized protein n=1 Tax=Nocardioides ginsengisegetis TaxID=661491 RepID=A0A7W3IZE2_9ACTN|nr:hypothetical protein [Nocardioides ginsengisegetis]MBA8803431.1 hypothetical protein [Nocardioides ginsengisegetis]